MRAHRYNTNLFLIKVIGKKTRWFNRKNKKLFKMAFKHASYFLSPFKNQANTKYQFSDPMKYLWSSDWKSKDAIKRFGSWSMILRKRKGINDRIYIDRKLLQYWYKKCYKVVTTSINCRQNWTEWGYVIVTSCTFINFAQSIHNIWFTGIWF